MIKIAFYGKGGIGKSTTVTNLSVALARRGVKVLQIGCDPKADSTRLLRPDPLWSGEDSVNFAGNPAGGENNAYSAGNPAGEIALMIRGLREGARLTVMDHIRAREPFSLEDVVKTGYAGVLCVETGGPLPGQGCAGRAVITALEKLEQMGIYESYKPDVVLYDVLGDVVCGGFASPMRSGVADYVYILTSGESMALYAAANIALALEHFQGRGYARLGGLILNRRDVPDEQEKAEALAAGFGTQVIGALSRSPLVPEAEERGQCLLQAFPQSEIAEEYRRIAGRIMQDNYQRCNID